MAIFWKSQQVVNNLLKLEGNRMLKKSDVKNSVKESKSVKPVTVKSEEEQQVKAICYFFHSYFYARR